MHKLFILLGPTASGKSALAMELAERVQGEIVSNDSAQVFRCLNIGTAKPTREEQTRVRHHLIDMIDPGQQWSAEDYRMAADDVIQDVYARGRVPLVVGGTGLWLRALMYGLCSIPEVDPEIRQRVRDRLKTEGVLALHLELQNVDPVAAARIQSNDPQRVGRALEVYESTGRPISDWQSAHGFRNARFQTTVLGLAVERERLWDRIEKRTQLMFEAGFIEETKDLLRRFPPTAPGFQVIGYKQLVHALCTDFDLSKVKESISIATRQYAKRQMNWFRQMPEVVWMDTNDPNLVENVYQRLQASLKNV